MDSEEVYLTVNINYNGKLHTKKSSDLISYEEIKNISKNEFNIPEEDCKYMKLICKNDKKDENNEKILIENDSDIILNDSDIIFKAKEDGEYNYKITMDLTIEKNPPINKEKEKDKLLENEQNENSNENNKNSIDIPNKTEENIDNIQINNEKMDNKDDIINEINNNNKDKKIISNSNDDEKKENNIIPKPKIEINNAIERVNDNDDSKKSLKKTDESNCNNNLLEQNKLIEEIKSLKSNLSKMKDKLNNIPILINNEIKTFQAELKKNFDEKNKEILSLITNNNNEKNNPKIENQLNEILKVLQEIKKEVKKNRDNIIENNILD